MERCNSYRCCYMYSGVSSMNICPTSRPVLCETIVLLLLLCYIKAWRALFMICCRWWDSCTCSLVYFYILFFCLLKERSVLARFSSTSILCGSIPEENTETEEFRVLHEMFSGKLTFFFFFFCLNYLGNPLHLASGDSSLSYMICPLYSLSM